MFVALARYNRLSDVVLKGAAGDSSRGQGRESAAVHCPVAADAAAGVHGEGGTFAHGNTAAIAAGRVAFTVLCSTDASAQDQIGPGIDRATVARGCIAGQRRSCVQVYACAGGSIDRAAVAAGGLAAGDGAGRGNGGKALRGIHTAARRSPAVGNGSVHRKGRAGIQPNRAAVTGGHGVLQRRGAADRQAHRACHTDDTSVCRGGDRLRQRAAAVQDNPVDGQRAAVLDHAALFKAAIDRGNIVSVALPLVVGIIRIRRQSRGQGDGFAAVEDRRPFHGVLRYHHFDAQGPGYGAIAGGSEVSAVDLVKGILQMSEDRRLQVAGRVPVIQQRAASVGDLADDLQEAVRKGHLRGINRLLRAFHSFGRGLFADRAFLLYGIHRFGAILGHLSADVGPLRVCENLLHGILQIGGQALDRERFAVHEAESFRHALYEAQRSVGLVVVSVSLCRLKGLADALVIQGQRERKALVHVRRDFADDLLGNSELPGLAGVGENRLGKAGGILCAHVLTQLSGYGQRFIIRKGIGSSVLLRRRRVILCRSVEEDLRHLIMVTVKAVRENRRCRFSRFQRHRGDTVRAKAHTRDEAALCRRQCPLVPIRILQGHREGEHRILIGAQVAADSLGHGEQGMILPIDLCITGIGALEAAQVGVAIIDEAEQLVAIGRPGSEGLAGNAMLVVNITVRRIDADLRAGVQAAGVDDGVRIPVEPDVAAHAVLRVVRHGAVSGEIDSGVVIVCRKRNAAAVVRGAVAGNGAAVHIELRGIVHPDAAAVFRRAAADRAAVHGEGTVIETHSTSIACSSRTVLNQTAGIHD